MESQISKIGRPFIVGHRGASSKCPENTVLSIEQAIKDGAEAVEFDIHLTKDNEVVVIHDSSLERTTTGEGMVAEKNYFGEIEYLVTKKEPRCSIPRFQDVLDVLLKPENSHIWAVIDIKMTVSPEILIILAKIFKSRNEDLSVFSRFSLGLWHKKFIPYARTYLSGIPIVHIGSSLEIAKTHFSDADGYNLSYYALYGSDGQNFINEEHRKGKPVFAWTINEKEKAFHCHNWQLDAIMTDKTEFFVNLFKGVQSDDENERKVLIIENESWYTNLSNFVLKLLCHWVIKWYLYKVGDH